MRCVDDLAPPRRSRRGQDPVGRGMGARRRLGPSGLSRARRGPDRARRRDSRRCSRRHDRGAVWAPRDPFAARRTACLVAEPAASRLAERGGRAQLLVGGSRRAARPAIRSRLGRRTRQVAASAGDLGHAPVRSEARAPAPPGRHDDPAPDPPAEGPARRPADDRRPDADGGERRPSCAGLPPDRHRPLRRHAARAPGTRRRDDRRAPGRPLETGPDRRGTDRGGRPISRGSSWPSTRRPPPVLVPMPAASSWPAPTRAGRPMSWRTPR